MDLLFLMNTDDSNDIFDPEKIIDKYEFDAIIIQSDRPLRAYLDSNSDKYIKIMSDQSSSYYHVLKYYNQ